MIEVQIASITAAVVVLAVLTGMFYGACSEERVHREVCSCKHCTAWRIERDAQKQANELRKGAHSES